MSNFTSKTIKIISLQYSLTRRQYCQLFGKFFSFFDVLLDDIFFKPQELRIDKLLFSFLLWNNKIISLLIIIPNAVTNEDDSITKSDKSVKTVVKND